MSKRMNKYIRIDGGIYDATKGSGICTIIKVYDHEEEFLKPKYANGELQKVGDKVFIIGGYDYKVTNENTAESVLELIRPGDLVEVDGYVMEVASVYDEEYKVIGIARPKECDDTRIYSYDVNSVRKLYIPDGSGFKLMAIHHTPRFDDPEEIKEKGEWELVYDR